MVTIRPYQPSDYSQVKALLQEADLFAQTWESEVNLSGMCAANPDAILVAVDDDTVVGNLFTVPYGPKIMFYFRLAVRKSYQKRGIATMLLDRAHEIGKAKGVIESCLFADHDQPDLHAFYAKRGFVASTEAYKCMWKELK